MSWFDDHNAHNTYINHIRVLCVLCQWMWCGRTSHCAIHLNCFSLGFRLISTETKRSTKHTIICVRVLCERERVCLRVSAPSENSVKRIRQNRFSDWSFYSTPCGTIPNARNSQTRNEYFIIILFNAFNGFSLTSVHFSNWIEKEKNRRKEKRTHRRTKVRRHAHKRAHTLAIG